jgi:histidinol-phosphate/aromatic aminotransferase/cobyric acid decarboxylase-like protein
MNDRQELTDSLDNLNVMIVVLRNGEISGFVSVTPPDAPTFSIDKYFSRHELPFEFHERLFEVRLLTVVRAHRSSETAALLLYAALRWVAAYGGTQVVAIGRREVLGTYLRIGMELQNQATVSGTVNYELLLGDVGRMQQRLSEVRPFVDRLRQRCVWNLPLDFDFPASCFHGGAFFKAIGEEFENLSKANEIINADVLDAWYAPAPAVLEKLKEFLPWLIRTSPPTHCDGLLQTIADIRGVPKDGLLPGAGSSDLIFRVLRHWLTRSSRVLILDPMYGEYAHVLDKVIGCEVVRLVLHEANAFQVSLEDLVSEATRNVDLVILVNPNSPTGQYVDRSALETAIRCIPVTTRVWIDETYVEYAGRSQSLEQFAAKSQNVVVCKSMSKVYALSGMRVAYLCARPHQLEALRPLTPPWVVGLPSQVAAVAALQNEEYYFERIRETHQLRECLSNSVHSLGWHALPSTANFLLCRLPDGSPDAEQWISQCRTCGLYLRNPFPCTREGGRHLRIAVKDAMTNERMVQILRDVLEDARK